MSHAVLLSSISKKDPFELFQSQGLHFKIRAFKNFTKFHNMYLIQFLTLSTSPSKCYEKAFTPLDLSAEGYNTPLGNQPKPAHVTGGLCTYWVQLRNKNGKLKMLLEIIISKKSHFTSQ